MKEMVENANKVYLANPTVEGIEAEEPKNEAGSNKIHIKTYWMNSSSKKMQYLLFCLTFVSHLIIISRNKIFE